MSEKNSKPIVPNVERLDKKGNPVNPDSLLQEWCIAMDIDFPTYHFLNADTLSVVDPVFVFEGHGAPLPSMKITLTDVKGTTKQN